MIRKYHNHKLQTTPWHSEEEPLNHHETPGRQIKQSNQLSLPHQAFSRNIIWIESIILSRERITKKLTRLRSHMHVCAFIAGMQQNQMFQIISDDAFYTL